MNHNHLMLFYAVAQQGSFSAAAEKLAISQPAVSMQVAELERNLGVRLLDRLPRGVRLTQAGQALAEYAQRIAALERSADQAMYDIRQVRQGRLAVGCSTTIGAYVLPALLARFSQTHPGIQVDVRIGNTAQVQQALLDGVLHLGLTEGFVEHEHLAATTFRHDQLIAIDPPGHPLRREKSVSLERFVGQRLIMREAGSGTRAVLEHAAAARGVPIQPFLELAGTEVIKAMVAHGVGVAIVSRLAVTQELTAGRLIEIPLVDCTLRRPLHHVWVKQRQPSPAALAFLKLITEG